MPKDISYKQHLQSLSVNQLKQLVKKYELRTRIQVSKLKKSEIVDALLTHTSFDDKTKTVKIKEYPLLENAELYNQTPRFLKKRIKQLEMKQNKSDVEKKELKFAKSLLKSNEREKRFFTKKKKPQLTPQISPASDKAQEQVEGPGEFSPIERRSSIYQNDFGDGMPSPRRSSSPTRKSIPRRNAPPLPEDSPVPIRYSPITRINAPPVPEYRELSEAEKTTANRQLQELLARSRKLVTYAESDVV